MIQKALLKMNLSTAAGLNGIPIYFWKSFIPFFKNPLFYFFAFCKRGICSWKLEAFCCCPCYKGKEDRASPSNYRPICLTQKYFFYLRKCFTKSLNVFLSKLFMNISLVFVLCAQLSQTFLAAMEMWLLLWKLVLVSMLCFFILQNHFLRLITRYLLRKLFWKNLFKIANSLPFGWIFSKQYSMCSSRIRLVFKSFCDERCDARFSTNTCVVLVVVFYLLSLPFKNVALASSLIL